MREKEFTYILHHYMEEDEPYGSLVPPIFQTSIFTFKDFKAFQTAINHEEETFLYTRGNNPTVKLVEEKLARLEHAETAQLFSSGVSAISAAVMAFIRSGDHIISVTDAYGWTKTLFDEYLARFGVEVSYVSGEDPSEIEALIRPNTRILYLESPTTFTFKLQDLKAVSKVARSHGIKTMIDNSWATPYFQNPIDFGIDIVIHSTSKYLGGHNDIMGGVVIGSSEDIGHIFQTEFLNIGGVPDPFAAWLLIRGLRTLHIRMERHFNSCVKVVKYLETHPKVERVLYPFSPSHPQYELAKRQMRGGSSLFSIKLKTSDKGKIEEFTNRLKYFKKGVSWGGYNSLLVPYIVPYPDEEGEFLPLVRLYVGLEDPGMLCQDLEDALNAI